MSAYNLLIPFISVLPPLVCACELVRVRPYIPASAGGRARLKRRGASLSGRVCVCVRVENESPRLIHSLKGRARSPFLFSPHCSCTLVKFCVAVIVAVVFVVVLCCVYFQGAVA